MGRGVVCLPSAALSRPGGLHEGSPPSRRVPKRPLACDLEPLEEIIYTAAEGLGAGKTFVSGIHIRKRALDWLEPPYLKYIALTRKPIVGCEHSRG